MEEINCTRYIVFLATRIEVSASRNLSLIVGFSYIFLWRQKQWHAYARRYV